MALIICSTAAEVEALGVRQGARGAAQLFAEHRADLHMAWVEHDAVVAQCSLWWTHAPQYQNDRVGLIGHFHATDASAVTLLQSALDELKQRGCTIAIGPMDGNTWHSYRLVTESGPAPPFFLEPHNPPEWPGYFEAAELRPLAQYYSAVNEDLGREDARVLDVAQRFRDAGVVIRCATSESLTGDLESIFSISLKSFARNFLYTPIAREEFFEQYHRVLPYVDPRLVLIAERGTEAAGFLFAIPDLLQRTRGQTIDTTIIKTVAIRPDASFRGLGGLLVAEAHRVARELGFRRCIHALMHESNTSLNISRHYANIMRRYTLYARSLQP